MPKPKTRIKLPLDLGEIRDDCFLMGVKGKCPVCGKRITLCEPYSFASISGGTYLQIEWHGAHTDCGGVGIDPDTWARQDVVANPRLKFDQFQILVCSTRCVRDLFSAAVDSIEDAVAQQQKNQKRKLKAKDNKAITKGGSARGVPRRSR